MRARRLSKLAIASTSYMGVSFPDDTYRFLEHAHSLGAAGIQAGIHGDIAGEATSRADVFRLRARAEQLEMSIEAMVPLPGGNDTAAFEHALEDARNVGAVALRAASLGSRRYASFASAEAWREHVEQSMQAIAAAVPLLDRYKIPLGLENHKDWRTEELAAIMEQYSSPYLGVCLDFGNNIALLDSEPMATIERLAPFAVNTHLKDMAVEPCEEGFLLSEVPLGEGYLDLPEAVRIVERARPNVRWSLEMITRDPLKVPCLADEYWATFPNRSGLEETLRFVDTHKNTKPLPRISGLPLEKQIEIEEENAIACLNYAAEKLGL